MPCLSSAATEWRAWRAVLRNEFGHPRLQSPDLRTQCHEFVLHDHHQAHERFGRFARKLLDLLSLEWCVQLQRTAYDRINLLRIKTPLARHRVLLCHADGIRHIFTT